MPKPLSLTLPAPTAAHPDWKAPRNEGELLIWPAPAEIIAGTRRNHRELHDSEARIQNIPLRELRRAQRELLATPSDALVIAGGHQTELYHPGVWAKDALAAAIAGRLAGDGGRAWHLAVDTDQPRHLGLRWPGGAVPITDDAAITSAAWSGLLREPTPGHLEKVSSEMAGARWAFTPMAGDFFSYLKSFLSGALPGSEERSPGGTLWRNGSVSQSQALSRGGSLPPSGAISPNGPISPSGAISPNGAHSLSRSHSQGETISLSEILSLAMERLDGSLGVNYQVRMVSPLLMSDPYLVLLHHWLGRAGELAGAYNLALAAYRRAAGIGSASRPMPDLDIEGNGQACEAPFWVDDLAAATRTRARVAKVDGRWCLKAGKEGRFTFDESADGWEAAEKLKAFLAAHHLRISPRALTLTLYFRLLLVDQFIHGIGGARYDQVTDALIAGHWGIRPPEFCVTTATLYFPTAEDQTRVDLNAIEQQGRRLRHQLPGSEKRRFVEEIAALPRRSVRRSAVFGEMHRSLAAARANNPQLSHWENRLASAKMLARDQAALFDRELFYAIQPRHRLVALAEEYRSRVDAAI